MSPDTGLRDGQQVRVEIEGFSPSLTVVVVECADKGNGTTQGDCDLERMALVSTDASGAASALLTVRRGPFGANGEVCGSQPCLISVNEASPSPSEQADTAITFG